MDALEFHAAWLEELRRQVVAERARAAPQPAAFVSFNHRWTQVVAATSLHARDEGTWATRCALPPCCLRQHYALQQHDSMPCLTNMRGVAGWY